MFTYKLIKELDKDGITIEETLNETKDKAKFIEYIKEHNIDINTKDLIDIETQLREYIKEKEKIVETETPDLPFESKLEFIYSPTISRKVVDTSKAPSEYLIIEIKYRPLDLLKKEIEKIFEKEVNINFENKIYFKKQQQTNHIRILLTQYSPEMKKSVTVSSIKFDEGKYKNLKAIEKAFNELL